VSFVEKVPAGVDKKGNPKFKKVEHFFAADKVPSVVYRRGFRPPLASYVKLTDPATGRSTFARVLEGGPMGSDEPQLNEASLKTYENLGYTVDPQTGAGAPTNLTYDVVGSPPQGGFNHRVGEGDL